MRILTLTFIVLVLGTVVSKAQQQAQYSMYMMNNYTLNPAVGGTENYTDLKASFRTQWVGLDGAPTDFYVSGHTSIGKTVYDDKEIKPLPFHGVGGYIYNDKTGPTTKIGAYGSYAYHLPVTNTITASFGAFLGFQQYRVDADQLIFHDDQLGVNENAADGLQTKFLPDANIGTWIYHENWYAGASLFQVLNNGLDFEDIANAVEDGKLNNHFFATAGYRVPLNDDFTLVPSFVIKSVSAAPVQIDFNAKLRYKQLAWFGTSYRNKDAFIFIAGVTLMDVWDVGYSYDLTTSNIKSVSSGSHEVLIGYRLVKDNTVHPTSQFW